MTQEEATDRDEQVDSQPPSSAAFNSQVISLSEWNQNTHNWTLKLTIQILSDLGLLVTIAWPDFTLLCHLSCSINPAHKARALVRELRWTDKLNWLQPLHGALVTHKVRLPKGSEVLHMISPWNVPARTNQTFFLNLELVLYIGTWLKQKLGLDMHLINGVPEGKH